MTATEFTSKLQKVVKETESLKLNSEQKRILEKEINEMVNHATDIVLLGKELHEKVYNKPKEDQGDMCSANTASLSEAMNDIVWDFQEDKKKCAWWNPLDWIPEFFRAWGNG